jgi:hypothetical protein
MIDKVANALYEFHGVKSMSIAKDMARAAVEAMRVPTEGMLDKTDGFSEDVKATYQQMIDAALKE